MYDTTEQLSPRQGEDVLRKLQQCFAALANRTLTARPSTLLFELTTGMPTRHVRVCVGDAGPAMSTGEYSTAMALHQRMVLEHIQEV